MNLIGLKRNLRRLFQEPDNSHIFNDIGAMLYALKDYGNAHKFLERAYDLNPFDPEILFNYAHALYSVFEWQKAAEVFDRYLKLEPGDSVVMEKAADACYQSGDYGRAANILCRLMGRKKESNL